MATKQWSVGTGTGNYTFSGATATKSFNMTIDEGSSINSSNYSLNSISFRCTITTAWNTHAYFDIYAGDTYLGTTNTFSQWSRQDITMTLNNPNSAVLDLGDSVTFKFRASRNNGSTAGDMISFRSASTIYIICDATENKTKVSNPASISTTRKKNSINISWPAGSGGTNTTVSGYKVIRNTSKSETGATTVVSSTTSRSISHNPGNTTAYYYGVKSLCSNSAYNADGYTWTSSTIKLIDRPSVNQWSKITKSQMDSLQTWINDDAPNITQFAVIKSSAVTKYKSATQFAKINASWYNTD